MSTQIVPTGSVVTIDAATQQWELIQRQCKAFLESGFLPTHIKSPAQAITIAWKGRELGIPPLQAFSSISVIGGKPCLSAELMLALMYQRIPGIQVTFTTAPEAANKMCELEIKRPQGNAMRFRFTIEDAQRAGLIKPNSAWEKYPAALLRARCISAAARAVAPDAIMGCYTPEEMGGEDTEVATVDTVVVPVADKRDSDKTFAQQESSSYQGRVKDLIAKMSAGEKVAAPTERVSYGDKENNANA